MFIVLRIKWRYSAPVLMKLGVSRPIFWKRIKYWIWRKSVQLETSCSMQTDRQTDKQTEERIVMKKPTVVFRNFVNANKHFRNLWTNSWIKIDQLDVTCFIISLFTVQHVSNVSTVIFRSLRLIVDLFHVLYCSGSMWYPYAGWSFTSACIRIPHHPSRTTP